MQKYNIIAYKQHENNNNKIGIQKRQEFYNQMENNCIKHANIAYIKAQKNPHNNEY